MRILEDSSARVAGGRLRTFAEGLPGRMRPGRHGSLVFERDYGAAVAAEGGNFLQAAVGERDGHDRAVAVDGMTAGGKIPASILGVLHGLGGGLAHGLRRGQGAYRQT